ncbi:alkaline phosphatase family protein [Marinobacter salinisoli]|uniref:Alkaline phosphatase family protein n=1 Tax=Marinobacter salinisoli TaxID=2769486 RepID=A0ABX7MRG5_9GAMM|nr:alkaline phosphatase D family protein [Marinobacter salinisoli]QSP94903.1 alkaline phosphatase family protein [Marinobacter salinisoli]
MKATAPGPVLAGPVLRHAAPDSLVFWLVTSGEVAVTVQVFHGTDSLLDRPLAEAELIRLRVGTRAWLNLLTITPEHALPRDTRLDYDLGLTTDESDAPQWIRSWAPHLCPDGRERPGFTLKSKLDRIFHGSCRKPHHPTGDGLVRVDGELHKAERLEDTPSLLLLTGDQIYTDDVAGPMLHAIQCVIQQLGLYQETLEGASLGHSKELVSVAHAYYHRDELLPESEFNEDLIERFFGGVRKPVFTTAHAGNHLISFAEVMAMYLLVWSPQPWALVTSTEPVDDPEELARYRKEQAIIDDFRSNLPRAARALANVPVYMIFDDHDVTDDWNLSALWETTAYEHPFSRRIIGNALLGYLLCQGWGNQPQNFAELIDHCQQLFNSSDPRNELDKAIQDQLIDALFDFQRWHYSLLTSPRLVVLDTRTHRWRSELRRSHPSGLMDWEALTDFQHEIMGEDAVVVVSAAPMFGVKLIEMIQRVFTFFGKPLLVDAENWMAHRGAASVLLNIFGHPRTPRHFVILSGDVHYSFAYDVRLRHMENGPHVWQITSSGIKNEFPNTLLEWLDRLNRWLFAPWSPLNWFTKRRRMWISPRLPRGREAGERLWNGSGIGDVRLDNEGAPTSIRQLNAGGGGTVFQRRRDA